MLSPHQLRRYSRHLLFPYVGIHGQQRLRQARVLVVGCGGLGSPILLYLAAAGIGTLGIIDGDSVEESNLQRQILYGVSSLRKSKVEQTTQRLQDLNPEVTIEPYSEMLTSQNALTIFEKYDLIIDGSDNFPTRYLVNDACVLLQKPFIYGAIYRFEGQVAIFNYQGSPTYRDLFPTPPPPDLAPNCAEAGVLGVLPGIVGSIQASEALKLILNIGQPLIGKLFLIDALTLTTRIVQIPRLAVPPVIEGLIDYEEFCGVKSAGVREISPEKLFEIKSLGIDFQLIDVRQPDEYQRDNLEGLLIPLAQLEERVGEIRQQGVVVVHCHSGSRSQKAIQYLKEKYGFDHLQNLTGGIVSYRKWERQNQSSIL
ncbi:MAG: molybdopterin-synthase adenylyltransferase MoeB [Runella sp.]